MKSEGQSRARYRVLFLCTGNSARSQMAEALLTVMGKGRFEAASAGTKPSSHVNPLAIATLKDHGIAGTLHPPQGLDRLGVEHWDFVITVCDRAKESCPIFPGQPMMAHWDTPDPTEVQGTDQARRAAFRDVFLQLKARIDLLLALPLDKLDRLATEARVRTIGKSTP